METPLDSTSQIHETGSDWYHPAAQKTQNFAEKSTLSMMLRNRMISPVLLFLHLHKVM
jgi:hypothetical protein